MYKNKKIDFRCFYGSTAVLFTMIPSHCNPQVIIDNLPFLCFPRHFAKHCEFPTGNSFERQKCLGWFFFLSFACHVVLCTTIHLLAKRVSSAQISPLE